MDVQTDERGIEYVEYATVDTLPDGWALCGTCGRAWNDEKSTGWTPTPSGRCPFEYDHEDEDDDQDDARQSLLRVAERERIAVELAGKKYASEDVELADEAPAIEYVDAGYWIGARVFIEAADVEELLSAEDERVRRIEKMHADAAAYFEERDVPGEWLDADGSWKNWESEAEGAAAEARRDALAEALAILRGEVTS